MVQQPCWLRLPLINCISWNGKSWVIVVSEYLWSVLSVDSNYKVKTRQIIESNWRSLCWSHSFSSPRVQPEVVIFWCQMKACIFLNMTPKFLLEIHYTLKVIVENVPYFSFTNFCFLIMYFHNSLFPVLHSCFCSRRENKKVNSK